MLPTLTATRYVTPLREGGSLPAVVETDEEGLWVVKFRGAGQGAKALVAELIVGLLARALDLPVPELALVRVDPAFGRTERDPEIQDILMGSHGLNVGIRYLDGAFNYEERPARELELVSGELMASLVWLDALVFNPDRTHRNPNLLVWDRRPWLIDHGAALYLHHDWSRVTPERARAPFERIRDHLFLREAPALEATDQRMAGAMDLDLLGRILDAVPDSLLADPLAAGEDAEPDELRERYVQLLSHRLMGPRPWATALVEEQRILRASPNRRLEARR